MLGWYQLGQLALALFVALVIAERVRVLCWRAPLSDEAQRWLLAALRNGDDEAVTKLRAARPESHAARILTARADGDDVNEVLSDLFEEARARLLVLRVSATLASTTGLLGGILALARGEGGETGLLALKAGAVAQARMSEAITTMAIGVAMSAVCFQALGRLREAAKRLVAQDVAVGREVDRGGGRAETGAEGSSVAASQDCALSLPPSGAAVSPPEGERT
ncbi:MAG: hypothetical protein ABW252_17265 [Polyangiales bacterium]